MRNLSDPEVCRRRCVSFLVLLACLALPASASAEATGVERAARGIGDGFAEMSTKPISPVTVENVSGAPGEAIPLAVTISARPGQSVLNTYLVGLPKGARLADGEHAVTATDEKAATDVTHWDLSRLSVMLPPTQAGTYTLAVVAVSRPDNGEPMNFTSSTFTLKAASESRDAGSAPATSTPGTSATGTSALGMPATGTSALGTRALETPTVEIKRPDAAVVKEALRPPLTALPSSIAPDNKGVQVGGATPKITTPVIEALVPQARAKLRREQAPGADTAPPVVAPLGSTDLAPTEFRPAAAPPALSALVTLPAAAPAAAAPAAAAHATAAPATMPPAAPSAAKAPPAATPDAIAPPAATAPAAAPQAPAADVDGKALVERAERLIRLGDISGARLVLERASDRGNPRATFLLAQTCDPRMLREWKVQGLKPDPDRARALYAKAAQEGVRETRPVTDARR